MLTPFLDIQADVEFDTIEAHQRKLVASNNPQLRVAQTFKHWRVGGQASLIHFLSDWAVRFDKPQLVLWAKNEAEAKVQAQNLRRTPHGLVALMAASEILLDDKTKLPDDTSRMIMDDILASAFGQFSWSSPKNEMVARGTRVLFLCSNRRNEEFPSHFYHRGGDKAPAVKNKDDFGHLFSKVFESLGGADKTLGALPAEVRKSVGIILYELFQNSHEHARFSVAGNKIDNALRGILVGLHLPTAGQDLELSGRRTGLKLSPFRDYLARFDTSKAKQNAFLEINVFDNGPGLAAKYTGKPLDELSLEQELEAVHTCWILNATSSDLGNKGLGLYEVASTLSQCQGFLRIRTGRLNLYRDFVVHPYPDGEIDPAEHLFDSPKLSLMDFKSRALADQNTTPLSPCHGLLLTMLIPIKFGQGARP